MCLVNPTMINDSAKSYRRKKTKKIVYSPDQLCFAFFYSIEARPRWLSLCEISLDSCRDLIVAMLRLAIKNFISDGETEDAECDKLWLLDESEQPFSFRWCCYSIGLDADVVLRSITR